MANQEKFCECTGFSLLEIILVLCIIALAAVTILPSITQAREGIAIEKTAQSLERCETAIHFILKEKTLATNRADISIAILNQAFEDTNLCLRVSAPIWPPEADLNSFNPQTKDSATMDVILKSGTITVTVEDISSPR